MRSNTLFSLSILLSACVFSCFGQSFTSKEAKCLVCKATVVEVEKAINLVDPKKRVDVSGFRMDSSGKTGTKSVQYSKSEMFLTELMENICDKMDDYAKATYKNTGKFTVLKFMTDEGMNPEISKVDFIQDGDLNKSLKHYCLEVLEDHELAFLKFYMADEEPVDADIKICTEIAGYCKDTPMQEEYELEEDFDDKDEL